MLTITIALHSATALLGLYLFILFIWWWIKQGTATPIYKYTTGLMFGIFTSHIGGSWLYVVKYFAGDDDLALHMPTWWAFRQILMLAPLAMYARHATRKIINENKAQKQLKFEEERRKIRRRIMDQNGVVK